MALTKVTGSVIKDSVSLSGNVSIGGTLTYQDVTNIDSLGIITARTGVDVSGGQLDVGSNVKIGNSGVATATNFKTGSSNLHSTGLTVGNNFLHSTGINVGTGATIHVPATNTLTLGTNSAERLRIKSDGKIQLSSATDNIIHTSSNSSRLRLFGGSNESVSNGGVLTLHGVSHSAGNYTDLAAGSGGHLQFRIGTSEKLRIDTNGKLLKGHTADIGNIRTQFNQDNQFVGATSAGIKIGSYANNAYASSLEFIKSRSATLGTNTKVHNGDTLGSIYWGAADGANYQPAAFVSAAIEGAANTNDVPTRLSFGTAKDGAAGADEKMRINPAGQIMIGDSTVGNSSNEKLIIQGMATNANYEASIALRRGSTIGSDDAGLGYIKFQDSAGSTGASMGGRADSGWSGGRPTHLLFYTAQSGSNSPTERMRIHSGGSVTKPHMPLASLSDSRAVDISNAELTSSNFYNVTHVNQGSHFNASNGRFTCPVAGIYRIFFRATTDQTQHTNVRLRRNGSTINEAYANGASGTTHSDSSEAIVNCSAGDYLHIQASRLKTSGGGQHKQVTFQLLH